MHLFFLTRTSNSPMFFNKIRSELKESILQFMSNPNNSIIKQNISFSHVISSDNKNTKEYVMKEINKTDFIDSHLIDVEKKSQRYFYNEYITHLAKFTKTLINPKSDKNFFFFLDDDATMFVDFIQTVILYLNKNPNLDILVWRCLLGGNAKTIPNLNQKDNILSNESFKIKRLFCDIDSLNYCVNSEYFTEWTNASAMDFKSLSIALKNVKNANKMFIHNVIGHINKQGPRNGSIKDLVL
jgi:hypothetical protein